MTEAPALLIDPADGSLRIDGCVLTVRPGLDIGRAREEFVSFYRHHTDHRNGFEWLNFGGVSLSGRPASFSLGFHNSVLDDMVLFSVSLPNASMEDGWPTQQAIDDEIAFVRRALAAQLGCTFKRGVAEFSWGSAWALFDPKGFQASAGLRWRTDNHWTTR